MSKTYVMGHSGDTAEVTFVPAGMRLCFYSPPGHYMMQSLAMQVIADGTIEPLDVLGGGDPVPNYELSGLEDREYLTTLTVGLRHHARLLYVGDDLTADVRLCERPDECTVESGHVCTGLLAELTHHREGDPADFHFLSCRGEGRHRLLPGEAKPDHWNGLEATVDHWRALTRDPQLANLRQFHDEYRAFTPTKQAQLHSITPVRKRLEWYWALQRLEDARNRNEDGSLELTRYLMHQDKEVQAHILKHQEINEELGRGIAKLKILLGDDDDAVAELWGRLSAEEHAHAMALDEAGKIFAWLRRSGNAALDGFRIPAADGPAREAIRDAMDVHNGAVLGSLQNAMPYPFTRHRDLLCVGADPSWWQYRLAVSRLPGAETGTVVARLRDGEAGRIDVLYVTSAGDPAAFSAALRRAVAVSPGLDITAVEADHVRTPLT